MIERIVTMLLMDLWITIAAVAVVVYEKLLDKWG
jgi:hypothetical protein